MGALKGQPLILASGRRTTPCRVTHPVKAGVFLLVGTLLGASKRTTLAPGSGLGMGVSAEQCGSATTVWVSATGGAGEPQRLNVLSTSDNDDLTTMFSCDDGDFQVYWSGEVNVTDTIVVGAGTTVRITGDSLSTSGNSSLSDDEVPEHLTSGLALPVGLTSAVVGVGKPDDAGNADDTDSFGSMIFVVNGTLILKDLVVRGGCATTKDAMEDEAVSISGSGGGVYSMNSNVTITRCDFSHNFAENTGGGIFASNSILQVADTMFRNCQAGFNATLDDEDPEAAGGGIYVSSSVA